MNNMVFLNSKSFNMLFAGFMSIYYRMTEPVKLKILRRRYEHMYGNLDEDPLVSIIIATYNRGKILVERTLPSIFNQTYHNLEVIIIGDHCIDNTPELLSKVSDPRVFFYDLPKRGKYPDDPKLRWFVQGTVPRNKGLAMAKGKWLAWMSDDDILFPNHIESLLTFAQEGKYEFVSAAYIEERYGEKKKIGIKEGLEDVMLPIGGMPTWLFRSYLRFFRWNINSWRKKWNRPVDYDMSIRMANAGVNMGYLDEVVVYIPPVEGTNTVGLEAQQILAMEGIA